MIFHPKEVGLRLIYPPKMIGECNFVLRMFAENIGYLLIYSEAIRGGRHSFYMASPLRVRRPDVAEAGSPKHFRQDVPERAWRLHFLHQFLP